MKTLSDAFVHTLQDMYYAENKITKALPAVIAAVGSADVKAALQAHLKETQEQIQVLSKVFKSLGKTPEGKKCDAIEGLVKECEGVIEEAEPGVAKDAAIIGCCQAIEHYEIARYGTLREWAKALGESDAHDLLSGILDQEKAADHTLTHLAVTAVNVGGKAKKVAAKAAA